MKLSTTMKICAIITMALLLGCAYQRKVALPRVGLPDEVFSTPGINNYGAARVGVFAFSGPTHAPDMGRVASRLLCDELEKTRAFRDVTTHPDLLDMTMRNVINIAMMNRYDLIITGKLHQYLEGTDLAASSVSEEIRVIKVKGGKPRVLWHARATETVSPALSGDYIFALGRGAPAPSTTILMRRNAKKFCKMILALPPRE